ncbi:MAG TPA: peptide chain release factor N(5)-glutamine methyltransferase [Vicinamibacterales bacterium]|nr:peptide chain release factor N(5)-glutamine methyltransferase [Vicinamibacterales bacterium]
MNEPRTVAAAVAAARENLLAAGVPSDEAAGDAEVLARHVLGWDLTQFTLRRNHAVTGDFDRAFDDLIGRRARREPVSQIVGHREFWGLDFEVTRDVLTPRPETELVVQATLDACAHPEQFDTWPPTIVDVGTGSGCIAVALAIELPAAMFVASDASLAALNVARRNAARHGVSQRIAFRHTDSIPPEYDVEIIVSNPPYIPTRARASLAPEVREYEPDLALFGGQDGLDFYRLLFQHAGDVTENGRMIVEVGYDQAAGVKAMANPRFWAFERAYRDLQGIERVLTFRALRPEDGDFSDHRGWRY